MITTVTQKGQVTIPVEIRRKLKVTTGQKISFEEKNGQVVIRPVPDFLTLMGSLKTKKKYNKKKAHEAIGKMLAKRHMLNK